MLDSPNFTSIPFHSLEGNEIGDSVATALADALTVNQSLITLRYIWHRQDISGGQNHCVVQNRLREQEFLYTFKILSLVQKLLIKRVSRLLSNSIILI